MYDAVRYCTVRCCITYTIISGHKIARHEIHPNSDRWYSAILQLNNLDLPSVSVSVCTDKRSKRVRSISVKHSTMNNECAVVYTHTV